MYIIKQSGIFIGAVLPCRKWISYGLSSNYIQFSKAKCKKIARIIYFYITEYIPQFAATSKNTFGLNFYRLFQREVHGD